MKNNYICKNKQYKFNHHTISLPIIIDDLPDKLQINKESLSLKSSFHVSLVCIGKIIEKNKIFLDNFENKIINDFCEFTKNTNIQIIKYTDFRLATDKERRSLIVMCEVSNLNNFFNLINKKYSLNIETQPTHLTLYTLQPDLGIFLTNTQDIKNMTKLIDVPKNISIKLI